MTTDENRVKQLRAASYATVMTSYGVALAYASHPQLVDRSLFSLIAVHWFWAVVQVLLGTGILLASFRGGYHMALAHSIGFIVQTAYASCWLASAILVDSGWFIWPLVAFLAFSHRVLSRQGWPRTAKKGQIAV